MKVIEHFYHVYIASSKHQGELREFETVMLARNFENCFFHPSECFDELVNTKRHARTLNATTVFTRCNLNTPIVP